MSAYISEGLSISYSVPNGLIYMLTGITGKQTKEVWCELSDIANICASRLATKQNQYHSWTSRKFPGTEIELRVVMRKSYSYHQRPEDKKTFRCEIKFGKTKFETFTQSQVNEYITEGILLGMDEEENVEQN